MAKKNYRNYENFKTGLLQEFAKSEDVLCKEIREMSREPHEYYYQLLDRMYAKLNVPNIAIDINFYLRDMYDKLSKYMRRFIKKIVV